MIINQNNVVIIDRIYSTNTITNKVEYTIKYNKESTHVYLWEKNNIFYFNQYDVFLISIVNAHCLSEIDLKTIIPKEFLDQIFLGKLKLCLALSHDAYFSIPTYLYENVIVKQGFPEESIILLSGSPDITPRIFAAAQHYGKKPIKTEWFNFWEKITQKSYEANLNIFNMDNKVIKPKITSPLTRENFTKSFLSLNRNFHPHRFAILCLLESQGLIEKGHVSYIQHSVMHDYWDIDVNETLGLYNIDEVKNLISSGLSVKNKIPLYLDLKGQDMFLDCSKLSMSLSKFYKDSYFSVVTETHFDNIAPRFLTEKIFKTMLFKHPFILVTTCGSVSLLKEIGYKSFNPFIDEDYDSESDDSLRLLKIIKQVKKLALLTSSELKDFTQFALPIVEENFDTLMDKKLFSRIEI